MMIIQLWKNNHFAEMQSVNYDLITCEHKSFASEFSWTLQPVIHWLLGQDDQDRHNFWCLKLLDY